MFVAVAAVVAVVVVDDDDDDDLMITTIYTRLVFSLAGKAHGRGLPPLAGGAVSPWECVHFRASWCTRPRPVAEKRQPVPLPGSSPRSVQPRR